jgi:hypothetical protein
MNNAPCLLTQNLIVCAHDERNEHEEVYNRVLLLFFLIIINK